MPQGENLTREHQVNAGKGNRKHGVYAMEDNELALWPEDKRLVATEIADELQTPELVEEHERQRVARGLVILQTLESYIAEQVKAGIPLDECPILLRWPAFQASVMRGLKQVRSRQDGKAPSKNVTEALGSMKVDDA